jgi:3',5'-nucleoside bisphosphate phosphatase
MKGAPFTQLCSRLAVACRVKADMHTHTTASDGDWTPSQLLQYAQKAGLQTLAITDHDTTRGYELASKVPHRLVLLPGVEITTRHEGHEVHLLAYEFMPEHSEFQVMLASSRAQRRARFLARVEQFQKQNMPIDVEALLDEPGRALGRRHLAIALAAAGNVAKPHEAFSVYLRNRVEDQLPDVGPTLQEALALVHRAGGWTSLAHPASHWTLETLAELKAWGLNGLECEYPYPKPQKTMLLRNYAHSLGLKITGGSDCHGDTTGPRRLGGYGLG